MPTAAYSFNTPVPGGDLNNWGVLLNANWEQIDDLLSGGEPVTGIDIDSGTIDGAVIGGTTPAAATFTAITLGAQPFDLTAFGNLLTGASSATSARTALGLGTLATQNTVNNSSWSGEDLALTNGGTGLSDPFASQAEAEAGLSTTTFMNPLRTAQAIAELSPSPAISTYEVVQFGISSGGSSSGVFLTAADDTLNVRTLGDMVFVFGRVRVNSTSGTGVAGSFSLPFTAAAGNAKASAIAGAINNTGLTNTGLVAAIDPGATSFKITKADGAAFVPLEYLNINIVYLRDLP